MYHDIKTKHDRLGDSPARFDWVDAGMILLVGIAVAVVIVRVINVDSWMGV